MRHLLETAIKIFRERGALGLAGKCVEMCYLPYCLSRIRKLDERYGINKYASFAFTGCHGLIKPVQNQYEITQLMMTLDKMKPKSILEIGTDKGGTLFLFSRAASGDASIISINLPGGWFVSGAGYPKWRIPLYKRFVLPNQRVHLIMGDSHDETTLEEVKAILDGKKIDFLFIDGDHTYEGIKKDFKMYSPLVEKNGMIAFHDIVTHLPESECEVRKFWNEAKSEYECIEIVQDRNRNVGGIGLIKNVMT